MIFDEGVNVIIGSSDVGKSAIMRAINWVRTNKPSGESFKSNWGGDGTRASIEVGDVIVSRLRTKTKNAYLKGEDLLKGFGTEVPEEVTNMLRLPPLNVQRQMDQPFLLSTGAGEVARYLNQLVDLDVIDITLSNLDQNHRQCKASIKNNEESIEELKEKLTSYTDLDDRQAIADEGEGIEGRVSALLSNQSDLADLHYMIVKTQERVNKLPDVGKAEVLYNEADQLHMDVSIANRELLTLGVLVVDIEGLRKDQVSLAEDIEVYQLEFDELMPEVCPLCGRSDGPYELKA